MTGADLEYRSIESAPRDRPLAETIAHAKLCAEISANDGLGTERFIDDIFPPSAHISAHAANTNLGMQTRVSANVAARLVSAEAKLILPEHLDREMELGRLPHEFGGISLFDLEAWRRSYVAIAKTCFGYIYFVGFLKYVKIGFSAGIPARVASLQISAPLKLKVYFQMPGTYEEEKAIHNTFKSYRLEGEWFLYNKEIRAWIKERAKSERARSRRCG